MVYDVMSRLVEWRGRRANRPNPDRLFRATGFERIRELAQKSHHRICLERTKHLFALFLTPDDARLTEDSQMAGDPGHVDPAPFRDLAYGTWAYSLSNSNEQLESLWIRQCLEKLRGKQVCEPGTAFRPL